MRAVPISPSRDFAIVATSALRQPRETFVRFPQ